MAKEALALEKALEKLITRSNLPSHYADFEDLTRDLVRELSANVVIIDRKRYCELIRPAAPPADNSSLAAATQRYKAHNDHVESSMRQRVSTPPPAFTIQQLTALGNKRSK